jgi:flagellar hook-length control protein FliK
MQAVTEPDALEPTVALAQSQASAPVLKIPRIELQPADLGTITVRISLTQGALDVRIETGRYGTAHMLRGDQDRLSSLLTTVEYRIEAMSVAAAPTNGAADCGAQLSQPSSRPQHDDLSRPGSQSPGGWPSGRRTLIAWVQE